MKLLKKLMFMLPAFMAEGMTQVSAEDNYELMSVSWTHLRAHET